jgi:TolB protein
MESYEDPIRSKGNAAMKKVISILLAILVLFKVSAAHADLDIGSVKPAHMEPLPIAVMNFYADGGADTSLARQLPEVITNDLASSGLFAPINSNAFIQDAASVRSGGVRFAEWRAINAKALVTGSITQTPDGRTHVEYRLWDVFGQKQQAGTAYTTTPANWRRIAHIISDEIYKRITGEDGYFDSRIVYIAESGPQNARVKRLAIMDQDGFNHHYLTDGRSLVLTPRFSPNQQKIAYMAYYNDKPRVYLYNLDTGHQEVLGDFPHMTFSPRFSPDGRKVVLSLSKNGNSDIYVMDLGSRSIRQLTSGVSLNTSPSFSPDGSQIVFESDRGGSQQLYVISASGGEAKRITFGKGRYASPVWSPRGDLIAFTRLYGDQFYIGVIRPNGQGEREITSAYHVEGPTWSPNGRVLAFFKSLPSGSGNERARLYSIDITGYNERELPTPGDASDPAWSPLNP